MPDVTSARMACGPHHPGVALLDRRLPGNPAAQLHRSLSNVPFVVLSPGADELAEVAAFTSGADDFVVWPSSTRALAARLTSLARRSRIASPAPPDAVAGSGVASGGGAHSGAQAGPDPSRGNPSGLSARRGHARSSVLAVGVVSIDPDTRRAFVGDVEVHLTRTEFELLRLLLSSGQRVLPRTEIVRAIWGDWPGDDHLIEVHVSRLRRKIVNAGGPSVVEAVRGVGYRLRATPPAASEDAQLRAASG
ncbi:MAG: response regulator transcription factor [Dermatophilaceae bacterium]